MRSFLAIGALNGALSVALGAFAAHALDGVLPAERLGWIETGARYQMAHALALLAVAWMVESRPRPLVLVAGWAFAAGTLLFCGGLYLAALADWRFVMPVVPVGGTAFILGWAALLVAALRRPPG